MSDIIKICKVHGKLKLDQTYNYGKGILCKPCHSLRTKKWASQNKEYCTEKAIKWANKNPLKVSQIKKKSWYKHHDKNIDESRKKYQKHKKVRSKNSLDKYHTNPRIASDRRLKRLFGMTQDEYDAMEISQDFKCAICKNFETVLDNKKLSIRNLAVDHCHQSKKVRGLLCFKCNIGLGKFNDSIDELQSAIEYLLKNK